MKNFSTSRKGTLLRFLAIPLLLVGCGTGNLTSDSINFATEAETESASNTASRLGTKPVTLSVGFSDGSFGLEGELTLQEKSDRTQLSLEKVGSNQKVSLNGGRKFRKFLGTHEDVESVTLDIKVGDKTIISGTPMTKGDDGNWHFTSEKLPSGASLTFNAHAYNSSIEEVFSGTTKKELVKEEEDVYVVMAPKDDGEDNILPRLMQITKPEKIRKTDTVAVELLVSANPGEKITYQFSSGGGSFSPSAGEAVLTESSMTIVSHYTAPNKKDDFRHTIKITNSQGNSVTTAFPTSVITGATATVITVFNPTVVSIDAINYGERIEIKANVVDDGAQDELRFQWEFEGGFTFADNLVNPVVIEGYTPSDSGTLVLRVTDENGDGGTSVFEIVIMENQFSYVEGAGCVAECEVVIDDGPSETPVDDEEATLIITGSAEKSAELPTKVLINLNGILDPVTNEPYTELTEANFTVTEDETEKAFTLEKLTTASVSGKVDIAFIVDTTGSMGSEINGVKTSVLGFADYLASQSLDVQVGGVSYADKLVDHSPLSSDLSESGTFYTWVNGLKAGYMGFNGGDWPENPLDPIAYTADNFSWRSGALRIFILLTDAPMHIAGDSSDYCDLTGTSLINDVIGSNGIFHVVSPKLGKGYEETDTKNLADATGGLWMEMPSRGEIDLTTLPISGAITAGHRITFETELTTGSHDVTVSALIEGYSGDTTFAADYESEAITAP